MNLTHSTTTPAADTSAPYRTDLEYLDDLMSWVEARADRVYANLEVSTGFDPDDEWADDDTSASHARSGDDEATIAARIEHRLARSRDADCLPAFERVVDDLGLDPFERMVLAVAIGTSLSRRLLKTVSRLDDKGFGHSIAVETLFVFAELGFEERVTRRATFSPRGSLLANDLITVDSGTRIRSPGDLLDATVEATHRIVGLAVGDSSLDDELLEFSSVTEPLATFEDLVMPDADCQRVLSAVERHDLYLQRRAEWGFDERIRYGRGVWLLFHGPPGTGKTMTAHAIADRLGKRILAVDIPAFVDSHEAERFLPALFREARIQNALLFFDECEVLFASRYRGNMLMSLLLTELERFEGVAVMATNLPEALDEALMRRILVKVRFPEPDVAAREQIWRAHVPDRAPVADDVDFTALAERFAMAGGYIKNAVLAALADAVHTTPGGAGPLTMAHFEQAADDQMRGQTLVGPTQKTGFGRPQR